MITTMQVQWWCNNADIENMTLIMIVMMSQWQQIKSWWGDDRTAEMTQWQWQWYNDNDVMMMWQRGCIDIIAMTSIMQQKWHFIGNIKVWMMLQLWCKDNNITTAIQWQGCITKDATIRTRQQWPRQDHNKQWCNDDDTTIMTVQQHSMQWQWHGKCGSNNIAAI